MNPPETIVGSIAVTATLSCQRQLDREAGKPPKIYTFAFSCGYAGSQPILQGLPPELDRIVNDILRKVRAWEFRASQAAAQQATIHKRPGT